MSGFPQGNEFNQPNGYEAPNNGNFNQNGGGYENTGAPNDNGNNMDIVPSGAAQPVTNEAARTLWMGDLDSWMDESFIKTVFVNATGEGVSVKIIRDRQSGNAGYCFVEFTSPEAATKALGLTGNSIAGTQGKTFKLNWASGGGLVDRRDDRGPEYSIFVGDLGPEVTEFVLVALFQGRYGSCKSAKIMTDASTGQSRGYGFVRFMDENDQQRALTDMQGVYCGNRPMRISTATPKQRNRNQNPGGPAFNGGGHGGPMMGNPMQQPTWAMSMQGGPPAYYPGQQPYGGMQGGPNGPPVGMGGGMPGGAMGGMMGGAPAVMGGGGVPGGNSLNQFTDPNNTTVFVGGLSGYVTEDELRSFFQGFGEITYVKIPPGKGCGFVQFVHRHAAEMAINQMQGYPIGNSRVRLSWGRSQNNSGVGTPYRPAPPPPHYSGGPPPPGPYNPGSFGGYSGGALPPPPTM